MKMEKTLRRINVRIIRLMNMAVVITAAEKDQRLSGSFSAAFLSVFLNFTAPDHRSGIAGRLGVVIICVQVDDGSSSDDIRRCKTVGIDHLKGTQFRILLRLPLHILSED